MQNGCEKVQGLTIYVHPILRDSMITLCVGNAIRDRTMRHDPSPTAAHPQWSPSPHILDLLNALLLSHMGLMRDPCASKNMVSGSGLIWRSSCQRRRGHSSKAARTGSEARKTNNRSDTRSKRAQRNKAMYPARKD
jgi:hypothetical protein